MTTYLPSTRLALKQLQIGKPPDPSNPEFGNGAEERRWRSIGNLRCISASEFKLMAATRSAGILPAGGGGILAARLEFSNKP